MAHLTAQEALMQAKASTEEARKATGSERRVVKHYQNAKNSLAKVDVKKTDSKDLEEMIVAFLSLAVVLDVSGEQPKEKAAKCRKKAGAVRQELNKRMQDHAAAIAPSLMGPGFSPTIAQAGVAHWSPSATAGNTTFNATLFASTPAVAVNTSSTPHQSSHRLSQPAVSVMAASSALGPPSFFGANVNPKRNIHRLPNPGEQLETTLQLACCLALLQPSVRNNDLSQDYLRWRLDTLNDSCERDRLETMVDDVIQAVTKDNMKDAASVAEVVQLAPVLSEEHSRSLIATFIDAVNESKMLQLHPLNGLATAIQGATPGTLNVDDLESILRCLLKRLKLTRSPEYRYPLLLAVSRVLDAMVDANIGDVDRVNLHGPLTEFLRDVEPNEHPYLTFQLEYATQALLNVPDDEDIWHAGFRRFWFLLNVGAGLANVPDPSDLKDTLESLEKLYKAGKAGIGNLKTLLDGAIKGHDGSVTFTVKEGLKFKSAWYRAIRKAESYIETGRLVEFKTMVTITPCRDELMFQWGICQLLGQFVTDSRWSPAAQQEAIAFIETLYKDASLWDRQKEVDQVIFDVLTIVESRNVIQFEAARTLLEEMTRKNTQLKPFADQHSPVWINLKFTDPDRHSVPRARLLKAVQDRNRRRAKVENLPDAPRIASLSDIQSALKRYHAPTLHILRISGEELDLGTCFVNLAIVEAPENRRKEKEELKEQAAVFHRMPSGERVRNTVTQSLIPLEQLFNKRKLRDGTVNVPRRILVQGRAGIGKSTLCKKLVHAHQNGQWKDLFKIVLWIPLRHLRGLKSRTLEGLFRERIFISQCLDHEQADLAKTLAARAQNGSILFILDGLDEIVTEAEDESSTFRSFLKMLLGQQQVVITSRPTGLDSKLLPPLDMELETVGFSQQNVKEFVVKVLAPEPSRTVQEFIQRTPLIQGLVNIPVQLDVICFSWDSLPEDGTTITMTGLYQLMVRKLCCKDAHRLKKTVDGKKLTERQIHSYGPVEMDELMTTELQHLGNLAFTGMTNHHQIEFEEKDMRSACQDMKSSTPASQQLSPTHLVEQMKDTSFLHTADSAVDLKNYNSGQRWHFLHLTFQEYFAATWIVRHFQSQQPYSTARMMTTEEMTAFVHQHKYNPQYEIVWSMVAGLLDGNPLDKFFELLQGEPRDLIGGRHQQILVSCLHEARARLDPTVVALYDSELARWLQLEIRTRHGIFSRSILGSQLSFPETLLVEAISSGHSNKASFIRTLGSRSVLSKCAIQSLVVALKDNDKNVRFSAAEELGKQSSLTKSAIQSLTDTLKDDDENVGLSALRALNKQSSLSGSAIHYDVSKLNGESWLVRLRGAPSVRSSAASVLGKQSSLPESAVHSLIAALKDDDGRVRSSAASALAKQSSLPESAIQPLITTLKDDYHYVRISAASALGNQSLLPESAIQSLISVLKDEDGRVKSSAALALGKQSSLPESAIQSLITILKDDDNEVKSSAASALGKQSPLPESAIQSLIAMLKDDNGDVRSSAAVALGKRSSLPESAIQSLISILKDDDGRVKSSAALALGKQSSLPESAIQSLITTLKDDDNVVRSSAAKALDMQFPLPESAIQSLVITLKADHSYTTYLAAEALGNQPSLSESAIKSIIAMLKDDNKNIRFSAAEALGERSSLPESAVQSLIAALKDDDEDVRYSAATALDRQSPLSESAIQSLVTALKDDDSDVRSSAAKALGKQSSLLESAIQSLIIALKDDYSDVRYSAASALGKQSSLPESVIQSLITTLKDDYHYVRRSAASALGNQSLLPESAIQPLIATLKDDDKGVRFSAAEALGKQSSLPESAIQSLITILKDDDNEVKSSAASALGKQSPLPESAIQSLIATLKDDNWKVRSLAAKALGKQSSLLESAIQSLIIALKDDYSDVRYSAASALGGQSSLPEPAILSLTAALKDDDRNVRSSAAEALGKQSPLPESAIQSLITTLKDDSHYVRRSAASALGNQSLLPESAILSLTATLKDDDGSLRSSAASGLSKQPSLPESAIRSLIAALEVDKTGYTNYVSETLGSHSPSVLSALLFLSEDEIYRLFKYHLLLYSLSHVMSLQVYDNGLHCCAEQGALQVQMSPNGSSRMDTISTVFKAAQQKALDVSKST
ncbi:bilin biosynthesis protein [Entomortierella parvispora]|uniref:Bilin biosynthesis protein n=1 Tax=Entomortierella parvispora TaxID=205924 RepID=A0A9P3GZD8_9FUNG|nr:bilin biosynthesis protein [Entomortierella parvispora]